MSMNNTPMSERVHIGFFGKRNAGKSSVMNAVTGQDLAVVSDVKGTTTDPVYKSMELLRDCRRKVYEVAELVGYKDVTYFSATFKKVVGISPSEYQDTCP